MFKFIKSLFISTSNKNHNKEHDTKFDVMNINTIAKDDYLGLAANAKNRAKIAIKDKNYEDAWSLFMKQKDYLLMHAEKHNFTAKNTIDLDASVHEDLANIHRLEGHHNDALVSMIYCVAGYYPSVQYKAKKLPIYLKRAKLNNLNLEEVEEFIYHIQKLPDYRKIQIKVKEWSDR